MEDNENNEMQEINEDIQDKVNDAEDASQIATKAATGNELGAAKDVAKKVFSDPKKTIKRWLIRFGIPIVAMILIPVMFFGILLEATRIIRETLEAIRDTIAGWIDSIIHGEGIVVDNDEVDAFIESLEKQGVSLADMGFGADEADMADDEDYKNDTDEVKRKKRARKYIKKFIEASLVTQTVNTHKNGIKGIAGGIELERKSFDEYGNLHENKLKYESDLDANDIKSFTLRDGKVVFNSISGGEITLDMSAYEQYSIPIMYFVDLCLVTQNPKYVAALADSIISGDTGSSYQSGTSGVITETGDYNTDGYTQRINFNGIQYKEYKQNSAKWANEPYWGGTIIDNGCGPTSIAVVLSGFSQYQNITPVDVANGMSETGSGTIIQRLSEYNIDATAIHSPSASKIRDVLANNQPALLGLDAVELSDGTHFTYDSDAGHWSAALAIDGDQVYVSNVYNSTEMRTGWVPISDLVNALADGTIIQINTKVNNVAGSTVSSLDGFLFIGDSRVEGIETQLEALGNDTTACGVGASTTGNWINVTSSGSGYVLRGSAEIGSKYVELPESVNGICIMLGTNGLDFDSMKTVLNNLHNRYPNAPIFVDSIYHVGQNYTYINNIQFNSAIDNYNGNLNYFCAEHDWATYVDISTDLYDTSELLKTEFAPDGLHISSYQGIQTLIRNIKNGVFGIGAGTGSRRLVGSNTGAWMTISILDSCVKTTKTTNYWYEYEEPDENGQMQTQIASGTIGPEETTDYTTSYYLTEVNHLLFGLSYRFERTYNESTDVQTWQNGNSGSETTTRVQSYSFSTPVQQDPVLKCEDDDFFVKTSKEKFRIPGIGGKSRAYDSFIDGGEMLFILMDRDVDNELLCQLTKYTLYKMTGINFGVTEFDLDMLKLHRVSSMSGQIGWHWTCLHENSNLWKYMHGYINDYNALYVKGYVTEDKTQYIMQDDGFNTRNFGFGVCFWARGVFMEHTFPDYGINIRDPQYQSYGVSTMPVEIADAVSMDAWTGNRDRVVNWITSRGMSESDFEDYQIDCLVDIAYQNGDWAIEVINSFKNSGLTQPSRYCTAFTWSTGRGNDRWTLFTEGRYVVGSDMELDPGDFVGGSGVTNQAEADALTEQFNQMLNTQVHYSHSYGRSSPYQSGPWPDYWNTGLTPFQCTWWANGRANMYLAQYGTKYKRYPTAYGDGGDYYSVNVSGGWFNYGSTPKVNSIISWSGGTYGHVAYVEGVTDEGVWISDAGSGVAWRGVRLVSHAYAASSNGYVYLDEPR